MRLPFAKSEWKDEAPCLAALGEPSGVVVATFEVVYMKHVMVPLFRKGLEGASELQDFAGQLVQRLHPVDTVDLDSCQAACMSNCWIICDTVLALSSEHLDVGK